MMPIIFIIGPTAAGKSEVSFLLSRQIKGEIVSCDSMLIYKEPKIITSKPIIGMLKEIKHHFIGTISAQDAYNVFDYYLAATKKVTSLFKKKVPAIVCGGSGLYAKALIDGIFEDAGKDENLRKSLEEKAKIKGSVYLHKELRTVDEKAAEKISPNDLKRIIRALEVYNVSGVPISQKKCQTNGLYGKLPLKIFGLRLKRDALYERINKRVETMFQEGVIEEVRGLLQLNLSLTSQKIIGIREIGELLEGNCNLDEAKENMKKNTRRLAKRQITWFKKDERIEWLDIDGISPVKIKDEILRRAKYEV